MPNHGLEPRQLEQEQLLLSRILGRGGFSTVYKGSWIRPGSSEPHPISVKVLLPRYCNSSCIHWRQFVEEANFLQSCDHPSVLKCHGLILLSPNHPGLKETYTGPVLAMLLDYIKEGTLMNLLTAQMIDPHARLYSLRQALHVLVDVADGLAHLHGSQPAVVHRDVKPGNVLLDKGRLQGALGADSCDSRDLLTARIADFGLHMRLGDNRPKLLRQSRRPCTPPTAPSPRATDSTGSSNLFFSFTGAPEGPAMLRSSVALSQDKEISVSVSRSRLGLSSRAVALRPPGGRSCVSTSAVLQPSLDNPPCLTSNSMVASLDECHLRGRDGDGDGSGSRRATYHALSGEPGGGAGAPPTKPDPCPAAQRFRHCSSPLPFTVHVPVRAATSGLPADGEAWPLDPSLPSTAPTSQQAPCGDLPGGGLLPPAHHATDIVVLSDGDEAEWVFDLTEATGSLVYMAPEVHLKLPYNTKADVYSFGVVMYEVLGRTLLAKTCIAGKVRTAEDYLRQVVDGWRPERPTSMAPELWRLTQACWEGDPNKRPAMGLVAAELRALLPILAPEHARKEPMCHSCVIC